MFEELVLITAENPDSILNKQDAEVYQRVKLLDKENYLKFEIKNRFYKEFDKNGTIQRTILKSKSIANKLHSGFNRQCLIEPDDIIWFEKYSTLTGNFKGQNLTFKQLVQIDFDYLQSLQKRHYKVSSKLNEIIQDFKYLAK